MAKRWFCLFFSGFNVIVVCFCVSGKVGRVLKCLFVSQFFGLCGWWFILVYLGLEGLGVFVFLVFVFLFVLVLFLFCLLGEVAQRATSLGPKPSLFFLCFVFFFGGGGVFFFLFFGGFKSQVRWPKGPPHLGPKPSLFSFSFLYFLFVFLCFPFFASNPKTLLSP